MKDLGQRFLTPVDANEQRPPLAGDMAANCVGKVETKNVKAPRGELIAVTLKKFETLKAKLDAGEVRLRRGKNGKCDLGYAMKLAGASVSAHVRHLEIKTAFEELIRGRPLDAPPPRDPRPYARVKDYIKCLERLSKRLKSRDVTLRRDENGALDRENVARLAGLRPGWDRHPSVIAAMDRLATEFPESMPDPIDEDEALALLDSYDVKLLFDGSRVPSFFGQPSIGLAAPTIGLPARAISTSEKLLIRFEEIAKRHGIAAPAKESGKEGVVHLALRKMRDEFDTAVLRGTDFPTLPSGTLDHSALLSQCGLTGDLVIQTKVRATATALHRELRKAIGAEVVPVEASLLADAQAVIDCYELHATAGIEPVPTKPDGTVDIQRVEHRYQLTMGTSKRFPEIGARIEAIAAATGEAAIRARALLDVALVQTVELHGSIMAAHGRKFRCDRDGRASYATIESAMHLRSGSIAFSEAAQAAISDVAETIGKRLFGHDWSEEPVAPLIDRYIAHVIERGYRWPRISAFGDGISKPGVCREIAELTGEKVTVGELTWHWVIRIRSRCKDVPQPGAVEHLEGRKSNLLAPAMSLGVLQSVLAKFKDGLPADPLDDRIYDLCEIAEAAWIDVRILWNTPAYMACIDEFHAKAGLKPFVHKAAAITIGALMERGRERRARETTSAKPGEAVARTVRALTDAMVRSGLTPADDAARIPELSALGSGEAGGGQLDRWRRYLGELQREAMLADGFPRSLKILLRMSNMAPRDLQRRIDELSGSPIARDTIYDWALGLREPSYAEQAAVELIEQFFQLEKGVLTAKICGDSRMRGRYELAPGGIPIPRGFDAHLPFNYPSLPPGQQRRLLNFVIDDIFTQDTAHSLRHRVVSVDEYRLPLKDWPEHLREEWRRYLRTRVADDDEMEIGADIDAEGEEEGEDDDQEKFLSVGGAQRLTSHLEAFLGFLHRSAKLAKPFTGVRESTPEWRGERAQQIAADAAYEPVPGLGIPLEHLSIGAVAVRDLYRAFVQFKINRSGDDSRDSINVAHFFLRLVGEDGFVRHDCDMRTRTAGMLNWWRKDQTPELRRKFSKLPAIKGEPTWAASCSDAAQLYKLRYKKLRERLKGKKNRKALPKLRDAFAPIRKVLKSKWPRRYYRKAIQRMIAARPTQIRLRHVWLRGCILALILFRTLLRIKNLARLTYRADNTGQLRREGKTWVVQIHKDNFKNRHSKYFIGGEFFRMTLNNDDGLYGMLDQYIDVTRQHFLGKRGEVSDESATMAEAAGRDGFFDDLLDFDDGEADEDRFFLTETGEPFSAQYLSACYYTMTKRHLVHNRYRRRGMRGLMAHGPHCVRHVGATAVLKKGGTYAQAGRVIQDSEESARKSYVEWGPTDSGQSAGELLDACA